MAQTLCHYDHIAWRLGVALSIQTSASRRMATLYSDHSMLTVLLNTRNSPRWSLPKPAVSTMPTSLVYRRIRAVRAGGREEWRALPGELLPSVAAPSCPGHHLKSYKNKKVTFFEFCPKVSKLTSEKNVFPWFKALIFSGTSSKHCTNLWIKIQTFFLSFFLNFSDGGPSGRDACWR